MARPHKIPSAMTSTPEEDQFFAKDRAASRQAEEEQQDAPEEVQGAVEGSEQAAEPAEPEAEPESGDGGEETEQGGADAQETPGRTVPIGELYAERERRKSAETLQQQQAQRIQQLEETFRKVVDRIGGLQQQPQRPPQQNIPAYDSDPLAHLKATQDLLVQQSLGVNQLTQQQQAEQQLQAYIWQSENQFRAAHPDYDAAATYARDLRVRELELTANDPTEVMQALRGDVVAIARKAYQTGKNPAELFYEYAKLRGYQPQAAQPAAPAQPVAPAQRQGNGAQRLKQIAAAQAVSRAPKGGVAPNTKPTLADLEAMNDDEFDKYFEPLWRQT